MQSVPHSRETLKPKSFTVRRLQPPAASCAWTARIGIIGNLGVQERNPSGQLDSQTVEILRKCVSGEWTRFVQRPAARAKELILDITAQHPAGRRFERRLVLEKQSGAGKTETRGETDDSKT